ncbi:MAG: succinate dehydrogenase [Acidobacteriales bacterium]|nr:succinate dehydrogenase [Terriglobales bacterium]
MPSSAASQLDSKSPAAAAIPKGVAPLRAGEGRSFLLRRLHSLSGIIPVGAFLAEHFVSNAFATNGPHAYADQVKFLTSLPFVVWIEAIFIWIPIAFHSLYGFYIWYRGDSNAFSYPWQGNWMYSAQRWTGAIAFFYIAWHTYTMRFSGVHLITNPGAAFGKVQQELQNPWALAFYVVGIVAASWHFGYGLWLFAAKWGIVLGERARRRFAVVCTALTVLFIVVGLVTVRAFFRPEWRNTPLTPPATQQIEKGAVKK